jgi:hypothetical protein
VGKRRVGMGGVGGILREPKSILIEPPWSIFYEATIFDTLLIRDIDCSLKMLFWVRNPPPALGFLGSTYIYLQ